MKLQSINRYEAYRDSGIDSVGELPKHWSLRRLKEILSIASGDGVNLVDISFRPGLYPIYGGNGVMGYTDGFNNSKDILIIGRVGAKCGNVHYVNEKVWVSDNALVAKSKFNKFFLEYTLNSLNLNRLSSANAQPLITGSLVKNQFITLPDKSEVTQITNYLDTKTAQIDRKIDLLSQKAAQYGKLKQSLINETVTRGLDKSVPMKDSGVEWIGEVPAHWEVRRVKEASTVFNGATPKSSVSENWDGELSWVTTDDLGKLNTKFITDTKRKITEKGYASCGTTICPIGSVVISGRAPIGHIGILSITASSNQGCKTLVINHKVANNLFVFYSLLSSKSKLEALGRGTTFIELSTKELGLFNLPMPSLLEQQAIATYLDEKTAHIDRIVATINAQIDKLKELRKTLINDVVTGKIRVV